MSCLTYTPCQPLFSYCSVPNLRHAPDVMCVAWFSLHNSGSPCKSGGSGTTRLRMHRDMPRACHAARAVTATAPSAPRTTPTHHNEEEREGQHSRFTPCTFDIACCSPLPRHLPATPPPVPAHATLPHTPEQLPCPFHTCYIHPFGWERSWTGCAVPFCR